MTTSSEWLPLRIALFITLFTLLLVHLVIIVRVKQHGRREAFSGAHLAFPTRCFACGDELANDMKWKSHPTRCFSCERNVCHLPFAAQFAQPNKCLSCEQGFRNPLRDV